MSECSLIVVAPENVLDSNVLDSNVLESAYPAWASDVTYAKGDRAYVLHTVYQSTQDENAGNNPALVPAAWAEVGPTNRWAVFDGAISTQTKNPNRIYYKVRFPRAITSVGVLNITNASQLRITVQDPTYGTVYDETRRSSRVPRSASWWQWFFGERYVTTDVTFQDLPTFPAAEISVEVLGGEDLAVGVLLFGNSESFTLGVGHGATVGIQDYSRKERNEFGDTVIVERAFAKRANFSMIARAGEVDTLVRRMAELRTIPCLWIGTDKYEATKIYGFYKNFEITISWQDYSVFSLELEGIT